MTFAFPAGAACAGSWAQEHPGAVQGQAASPWATANPQHSFLLATRAAWPQQPHKNPVLTLARASSLGVEESKTPKEAMGDPPQAVVMKTFGEQDETCEVRSASYDPSGLPPLPPPEKKGAKWKYFNFFVGKQRSSACL